MIENLFPLIRKEYQANVKRQGLRVEEHYDLRSSILKNGLKYVCQAHNRYVGYDQIVNRAQFDLGIYRYCVKVLFLRRRVVQSVFHRLLTIDPFHHSLDGLTIPRLMHRDVQVIQMSPHEWK